MKLKAFGNIAMTQAYLFQKGLRVIIASFTEPSVKQVEKDKISLKSKKVSQNFAIPTKNYERKC